MFPFAGEGPGRTSISLAATVSSSLLYREGSSQAVDVGEDASFDGTGSYKYQTPVSEYSWEK